MICVSIVSHGHAAMLPSMIRRLLEFSSVTQVIITFNIPEQAELPINSRLQLINNQAPKGFGANHNHAFSFCRAIYFCVLNPDIIFKEDPFPRLIEDISFYKADLVAPLVLNTQGEVEDSIRYFPKFYSLLKKMALNHKDSYFIDSDRTAFTSEWVAGMFMLFTAIGFGKLRGFDSKYYLYYEDVDICVRLWRLGLKLVVSPSVEVIHDARRASRKNIHHMKMHFSSMFIYLLYQSWRLPNIRSLKNETT